MDLQTRKINVIQDFLKLESEAIIAKFEKILKKENSNSQEFKPMSLSEFHDRIKQSTMDAKNGNVTNVEDLISEIEKWS